jgi:hypothetical protein
MYRTLVAVSVVALAACSTNPVPLGDARAVPPDRTEASQLLRPATGAEPLTFIRDGGTYSSAGYRIVWIDGEKVAALDTSEAVTVYLAPGKHLVTSGVRFMGTETMGPTLPIVVPGKVKAYRLTDSTGGMLIQPAAN